jgi:hypothetical protein
MKCSECTNDMKFHEGNIFHDDPSRYICITCEGGKTVQEEKLHTFQTKYTHGDEVEYSVATFGEVEGSYQYLGDKNETGEVWHIEINSDGNIEYKVSPIRKDKRKSRGGWTHVWENRIIRKI